MRKFRQTMTPLPLQVFSYVSSAEPSRSLGICAAGAMATSVHLSICATATMAISVNLSICATGTMATSVHLSIFEEAGIYASVSFWIWLLFVIIIVIFIIITIILGKLSLILRVNCWSSIGSIQSDTLVKEFAIFYTLRPDKKGDYKESYECYRNLHLFLFLSL